MENKSKDQQFEETIKNLQASEQRLKETNQQLIAELNKLKESEEKHKLITDKSGDLISTFDINGNLSFINPAGAKMYGYTQDEMLGMKLSDFLPDERPTEAEDLFKTVINKRETIRGEIYVKHKKGHEFPISYSVTPLEKDGEIIGFLKNVQDITEQKTAEIKILESEEKLRLTIDNSPMGVGTVDLNGRFVSTNQSYEKIVGYSKEELRNMSLYDITHPDDRAENRKLFNKIFSSNATGFSLEKKYIRKDGNIINVRVHAGAIHDIEGNPKFVLAFIEDITERKKSEDKLRESEFRYRGIIEDMPNLICCFSSDMTISFVNRNYCEYFGKDEKELVGTSFLELIPETERENVFGAIQLLSIENPILTHEHKVVAQNQQVRWQRWTNRAIFDSTGKIITYQSIGEDVTAQKEAEDKLVESNIKHEAMIENIGDVIGIVDSNGITIYQSPNMEKWFGWKPEDLIGTSGWDKIHQDDIERIEREFVKLLEKDTPSTVEYRFLCKDGSYKWIELTATNRLNDPGINGVLVNYRDISERKRIESALNESETRFRTVIEQSPISIALYSPDGKLVYGNPASTNIFRIEPEVLELLYKDYNILEDKQLIDNGIMPYLEKGFSGEYTVVPPAKYDLRKIQSEDDDYIRWIQSVIYPALNDDEEIREIVLVHEDITERKHAEETLKDNRNRLAAIFDNSTDYQLLVEVGEKHALKVVAVNKSYIDRANQFGIPISKENVVGKSFEELLAALYLSEEETKSVVKNYIKVAETKEKLEFNEDLKINNNDYYAEISLIPVLDSNGNCQYILYNSHDITDKKKTEKVIFESEERLRLALNAANQGLYDLNIQTGDAIVSPEYATMLGYEHSTFVETNKKWLERLHPDDLKKTGEIYQKYIDGKTNEYKVEFRQKTKNNKWKWILSLGKIVEYDSEGKPLRMLGTHTDITDRKIAEDELQSAYQQLQANEQQLKASNQQLIASEQQLTASNQQLKESEEKFRKLYENSPFGIIVNQIVRGPDKKPVNFIHLQANASAEIHLGMNVSDLIGTKATDIADEETAAKFIKKYGQVVDTRNPIGFEYYFNHHDKTLWVTAFHLIDDLFITTFTDISDRKKAEMELNKYKENLEKLVDERTSELKEKNKELEYFNDLFVGREFRINELKEIIKELEKKLNNND